VQQQFRLENGGILKKIAAFFAGNLQQCVFLLPSPRWAAAQQH
jgi:hypothetical protein